MRPGRALIIGNSDGIGLALTRALIAGGWTVTGISRRGSSVCESGYHHVVADVADEGFRAVLASAQASRGPFDVCVYCAGIGELLDCRDLSRESQVFRVNLLGAIEAASVVLPPMIAAQRGHFVALSSIGDGVSALAPSYAASKAGLSSYFEGLGLALRPRGVNVTNVRFGFVNTKMAKARIRPFMISADRAADVVVRCLRDRPLRLTYPRRMGALMAVGRWLTSIRLWFT